MGWSKWCQATLASPTSLHQYALWAQHGLDASSRVPWWQPCRRCRLAAFSDSGSPCVAWAPPAGPLLVRRHPRCARIAAGALAATGGGRCGLERAEGGGKMCGLGRIGGRAEIQREGKKVEPSKQQSCTRCPQC